jgi:hypothetical protein
MGIILPMWIWGRFETVSEILGEGVIIEEGGMINERRRELHKKERSVVYKERAIAISCTGKEQWQRMEAATVGKFLWVLLVEAQGGV